MSPSARSTALLKAEGFTVDTVERFIPGARIRRDLFGLFDLLAIRDSATVRIGELSRELETFERERTDLHPSSGKQTKSAVLKAAGWRVDLHGGVKRAGRWQCRREAL